MSHLTRGAWIEIKPENISFVIKGSRTSHEVRGLKSLDAASIKVYWDGRTSHEVRGLKSQHQQALSAANCVAPHTRCVD